MLESNSLKSTMLVGRLALLLFMLKMIMVVVILLVRARVHIGWYRVDGVERFLSSLCLGLVVVRSLLVFADANCPSRKTRRGEGAQPDPPALAPLRQSRGPFSVFYPYPPDSHPPRVQPPGWRHETIILFVSQATQAF